MRDTSSGVAASCAESCGKREHDPVGREPRRHPPSPSEGSPDTGPAPPAAAAARSRHAPPPSTTTSDHTTFFIASTGRTHGPPAALHPDEVATASSRSELVGGAHRGVDRLVPCGRSRSHRLGHDEGHAHAAVEQLHAADADVRAARSDRARCRRGRRCRPSSATRRAGAPRPAGRRTRSRADRRDRCGIVGVVVVDGHTEASCHSRQKSRAPSDCTGDLYRISLRLMCAFDASV